MEEKLAQKLNLQAMANAVRALSLDMVEAAQSGHPGMPLGAADIITTLFTRVLKHRPDDPAWLDRDRFVLSAGHASAMLYSTLHLCGYPLTLEDLKNFRQLGSVTSGHPEYEPKIGVESTTGPLGQGIGMAVGMAIAEKLLAARYPDTTDHFTWVLAGEGCLMEGISHEVCSLAGTLELKKLILLFDNNDNTIDGRGSLACTDDYVMRFKSYGWDTFAVDGHDFDALEKVMLAARESSAPAFIQCKTRIGKFSPLEDSHSAHGSVLGKDRATLTRRNLGMNETSFYIPEDVKLQWKESARQRGVAYADWQSRFNALSSEDQDFCRAVSIGREKLDGVIDKFKAEQSAESSAATRSLSGYVLERLVASFPELIGGSADLTGPNCTHTSASIALNSSDAAANYLHYGVREHAMGAIMNGLALHGPFTPYGGTFLAFADYMKPAIRLSALMNRRVVYVMTHDSIALGEDGPTHQPVEQLSTYRALPNLTVLRPADRQEVAEAWQVALEQQGPSMLVLSRQAVRDTGQPYRKSNQVKLGGYLLLAAEKEPQVTLIASGSEVPLALQAAQALDGEFACDVVSMPSLGLFLQQPQKYRESVLRGTHALVIEPAAHSGWEKLMCNELSFVDLASFGASGKQDVLLRYYGFVAEHIADRIRTLHTIKGAK